jgi:hypothetical protein
MKALTVLLMFPLLSLAQITVAEAPEVHRVGKIESIGTYFELAYYTSNNDTTYTFSYRNLEFRHINDIKSFAFSGTGNALNGFYQTIIAAVDNDKQFKVKLGEENLLIKKNQKTVADCADIYTDHGYCTISVKQVNKLFGKR